MPKLSVFPKAYMKALCIDGSMQIVQWIELAEKLDVDGLEWYAGFLEMNDKRNWSKFRAVVEDYGKVIPMLCYSPIEGNRKTKKSHRYGARFRSFFLQGSFRST